MKKPCNNCENSYIYNNRHYSRYNETCYNCEKYKKYEEYLESKRKYKIGEKIKTLDELLKQEFVYCGFMMNKPFHISVIRNWQFNIVMREVEEGTFYKAIRKEKSDE